MFRTQLRIRLFGCDVASYIQRLPNVNEYCIKPLTSKIWDVKTPPLNYSQTVADEATLQIDRRCEVKVVVHRNIQ